EREANELLDGIGELETPRDRVRLAIARARLVSGADRRVLATGHALALAMQCGDEHLLLEARVLHTRALLAAGRAELASDACRAARTLASSIASRAPAELAGAFQIKPDLLELARLEVELGGQSAANVELPSEPSLPRLVGRSPVMRELTTWISRVAR